MQHTQKNLRNCAALTHNQIRGNLTVKPDGNIQMRGPLAKAIKQDSKKAGCSPGALTNEVLKQMLRDAVNEKPLTDSDCVIRFTEDDWSVPNALFFRDGLCVLANVSRDRKTYQQVIEGPFHLVELSESVTWYNTSEQYAGSSCIGSAITPWRHAIAAALKGAGL
jgi:hypothetical protein